MCPQFFRISYFWTSGAKNGSSIKSVGVFNDNNHEIIPGWTVTGFVRTVVGLVAKTVDWGTALAVVDAPVVVVEAFDVVVVGCFVVVVAWTVGEGFGVSPAPSEAIKNTVDYRFSQIQ